MNESLDLRNRILKMRESNNLIVTKTDSPNNNLMSKFENSIKDNNSNTNYHSKNLEIKNDEEIISKSIKNNSENLIHHKDINEHKIGKGIVNDNEAQFLMLANKFNEAVEVILELSQKVEKLERKFDQSSLKTKNIKYKAPFFNLKLFTFLLIITITILGFFTIPIDFSLIKLILIDVLSMI